MARGNLYRIFFGFVLLFAASTLAATAIAQTAPLETQVKAAFLPKFAAYVNWPSGTIAAPNDPVELCIIGRDPFGRELDETAAHQYVDQHPVRVRRIDSTADAEHCQIAFLGGSAKQKPAAMQDALRGKPILTVTDASLGADRGMVHFALKDGRVRFHIDDALAGRNNLAISARLLSLAISVKPRARTS
jgi:hypothetical protein